MAAILIAGTAPALAKRVALVMGNSAYENAVQLPNPANDARAMTTKLRDLGFEVVSGYDLDYTAMRRTVAQFAKEARGADVALFFYAGHGMQVQGQNYLIPVDARFSDETALDFETISADFILRQMSNNVKVRMVFLDACRDNPLARTLARSMSPTRSAAIGVGLAEIKIEETGGEGSVIAFATSPGDVALDGEGSNSPFTTALLRHIDAPDTPIQNVMTRVTGDVYRETGQRQRPWVNASLIGEVYLNKTASTAAADGAQVAALGAQPTSETPAATPTPVNVIAWEREKATWDAAQKGGTVADYEAYLASYPNGNFADFARNSIARLQAGEPKGGMTRQQGAADKVAAVAVSADAPVSDPDAGSEATEAALGWSKATRVEVQARLNLAGYNVGRPDGAFGQNTRSGIRAWQTANGLPATGWFNAAQHALLTSQTQAQYLAYVAELQRQQAAAAATRSAARTPQPAAAPEPQRRAPQRAVPAEDTGGGVGGAAGAAFLGGVVGGIIGGAIGR
ncbi:Caspase domain protein [Polymorphum gilvum SL003B-26A1]|uniref:Caspase domain protein n=1 Tax=Polymorphum gilvum (strain LMG 25793 / CGMCC 1.9160 / SL003B-26A1) TaxID=991905 RepID=F2IWS5_POLGS|nr:Caspase domain protein [Polymorphum gilvum SL003B-26A1]